MKIRYSQLRFETGLQALARNNMLAAQVQRYYSQ